MACIQAFRRTAICRGMAAALATSLRIVLLSLLVLNVTVGSILVLLLGLISRSDSWLDWRGIGSGYGKRRKSRLRKYSRQDSNHKDIRSSFERMGCTVCDLSPLGNGYPDLLIGYGGICIPVEVKDGSKPPSKRRLTKDEERFRMTWTGGYKIVEDIAGVLETVALLQGWRIAICSHEIGKIRAADVYEQVDLDAERKGD